MSAGMACFFFGVVFEDFKISRFRVFECSSFRGVPRNVPEAGC